MEIIDDILVKMQTLKNLIALKDTRIKKLEKLKKAREEDVEHLEKLVKKLQEQNAQLSAQVEKHLEEKSNGNWAREGAVVWDAKDKLKGVLLENPRCNNELHFVSFVPNSGIENWPFLPHVKVCEPYKGQDKEEVNAIDKEKAKFQKFLEQIEVGDILIKGQLVASVSGKFSDEFEFLALTDTPCFFKGSTGFSKNYNWAKYDASNLKLPF